MGKIDSLCHMEEDKAEYAFTAAVISTNGSAYWGKDCGICEDAGKAARKNSSL